MSDQSKIRLWFFRDLSGDQRLALFSLFGMPVDEIGDAHGNQKIAFSLIFKAIDLTSEGEAVDEIGDAVLAWMVKYDLLDAGNEYQASDVIAVLNDLAPSDRPAPQPAPAELEVVAWQHTIRMDGGETATRLARAEIDRPWGKPGIDFDESFHVDIEPLVRLTDAQAHLAALTAKVEKWEKRFWKMDENFDRAVARAETAETLVAQLEEVLEKLRSYNVDIEAGRINYRPNDHVAVIDSALHPEKEGE